MISAKWLLAMTSTYHNSRPKTITRPVPPGPWLARAVQPCYSSYAAGHLEAMMIKKIEKPTIIAAAGNKKKIIEEYFGLVNSKDAKVSVAVMRSPSGWSEPGQMPEFDEYTVVLKGTLHVITRDGLYDIRAGEAILVTRGEWVRYSTPGPEGAEYVAVCLPAFSTATVHRDD
jgi:mannose-6-phosphate isomerase-like protein (cupin superfamily)